MDPAIKSRDDVTPMLDTGFLELSVIFIVALLVLGPKRLPKVAKKVGKMLGKGRQLWRKLNDEVSDSADDQQTKS